MTLSRRRFPDRRTLETFRKIIGSTRIHAFRTLQSFLFTARK